MLNRHRRTLPAVLSLPLTMIVSSVLGSGCGGDKLSDDAYGFIDLAPYYYDGSSASNPSAGLPREIAPTVGWMNGVRAEFYDFGLVSVTKKRTDGKLPDYAAIPPMYFFFDDGGNPLFSKPVYENRTGLWHMRGGKSLLNPNPNSRAPKNVPYSVRVRDYMNDKTRGVPDYQRPIVDILQHSSNYSGLWEIYEVTTSGGYEPDAVKSMATLNKGIEDGSFTVRRTQRVINCPVLDDRQYVTPTALQYGIPRPRIELWYRTKQGSCFLSDGWLALGDMAGNLYKANTDARRLNMFDVISFTIGNGPGARTTLTAPVSKMFIPNARVANTTGTTDVRYQRDNVVEEARPRMNPADPTGYRPIRWLWDYYVPQDPPYVASTFRNVNQMDPGNMVNRLTSNVPFTKNFPLIGANVPCKTVDDCVDVPRAPGINLTCAQLTDAGGARCDVPDARFGEFCAPGIAACVNVIKPVAGPDMMNPNPSPDAVAAFNLGSAVIGGYACHPPGPAGGYCFLRCDVDGAAGTKAAETVSIKYKGPDGVSSKTEPTKMEFDARCGNIPGYKCLTPTGTVTATQRVCLRSCDTGKPDTFNDEFCKVKTAVMINEKVDGDFQKGMKCSNRGVSGGAGCQWDPAYEPREPASNFIPAP